MELPGSLRVDLEIGYLRGRLCEFCFLGFVSSCISREGFFWGAGTRKYTYVSCFVGMLQFGGEEWRTVWVLIGFGGPS